MVRQGTGAGGHRQAALAVGNVTIDKNLSDHLLADLAVEGRIEPTQLQVVCDTLWRLKQGDRLTLNDYVSIGGTGFHGNIARQILKQRLAEKLGGIGSDKELELIERLLPELRTERNTKYVRSSDELVEKLQVDKDSLEQILSLLETSGFISRGLRGDAEVVELTHDYLVEHLTDLQESVRGIWPRRIIAPLLKYSAENDSIGDSELKQLITHDDLTKLAEKEDSLILSYDEARLLFLAALAHESHGSIGLWFGVALENEVPVWEVMRSRIDKGSALQARFVTVFLVDMVGLPLNTPQSAYARSHYSLLASDIELALGLLGHALKRDDLTSEVQSGLVSLAKLRDEIVAPAATATLFEFLKDERNRDLVALPAIVSLGWNQTKASVDVLKELAGSKDLAAAVHIALAQLASSPEVEIARHASSALQSFKAPETAPLGTRAKERSTKDHVWPGSKGAAEEPSFLKRPLADEPSVRYLAERISAGQCILFLGPGVHIPSPPGALSEYTKEESPLLGTELAWHLAKMSNYPHLPIDDNPAALARVAQYFELQVGFRTGLVGEVARRVSEGKRPSPLLRALARLNVSLFVTTNFDHLFEQALREAGKDPLISVFQMSDQTMTPDYPDASVVRPFLIKLHGDIGVRESLVITEEDLIQFTMRLMDTGQFSPLPQSLRYQMMKLPSLFIGYNWSDFHVRLLFKALTWKRDPGYLPRSYVVDAYPDPLVFELWSQQRREVSFLKEDLWSLLPRLSEMITGHSSELLPAGKSPIGLPGRTRGAETTPATDPFREIKSFIPLPTSPFRGIEPYRFADQPIFFARGRETQEILRSISLERCVLLSGNGGVGKTSLVNAGIIPAALNEEYIPERVRVQPLLGQELVIERIAATPERNGPYLPSKFFEDTEQADRLVVTAAGFITGIMSGRSDLPSLIIIDQFEEIVTLFEESQYLSRETTASRVELLNLLNKLIRDRSLPIKLLLVVRGDYLSAVMQLLESSASLSASRDFTVSHVLPPAREALHEIIDGPFKKFPKQFERGFSPFVVRSLVDELTHRDASALSLSELQIACLMLWRANDPGSLLNQMGLTGLLQTYGSELLTRLPVKLREVALLLMFRMITPTGAGRVVSEDELIDSARREQRVSEHQVAAALRALVESNLVRSEQRHQVYFYELASEFLCPWVMEQYKQRQRG